jgi:hypothetical protein
MKCATHIDQIEPAIDCADHDTAPRTASANTPAQIAKIASASLRLIGVYCRSGPGPGYMPPLMGMAPFDTVFDGQFPCGVVCGMADKATSPLRDHHNFRDALEFSLRRTFRKEVFAAFLI